MGLDAICELTTILREKFKCQNQLYEERVQYKEPSCFVWLFTSADHFQFNVAVLPSSSVFMSHSQAVADSFRRQMKQ